MENSNEFVNINLDVSVLIKIFYLINNIIDNNNIITISVFKIRPGTKGEVGNLSPGVTFSGAYSRIYVMYIFYDRYFLNLIFQYLRRLFNK